jgi:hypothetical protein
MSSYEPDPRGPVLEQTICPFNHVVVDMVKFDCKTHPGVNHKDCDCIPSKSILHREPDELGPDGKRIENCLSCQNLSGKSKVQTMEEIKNRTSKAEVKSYKDREEFEKAMEDISCLR